MKRCQITVMLGGVWSPCINLYRGGVGPPCYWESWLPPSLTRLAEPQLQSILQGVLSWEVVAVQELTYSCRSSSAGGAAACSQSTRPMPRLDIWHCTASLLTVITQATCSLSLSLSLSPSSWSLGFVDKAESHQQHLIIWLMAQSTIRLGQPVRMCCQGAELGRVASSCNFACNNRNYADRALWRPNCEMNDSSQK